VVALALAVHRAPGFRHVIECCRGFASHRSRCPAFRALQAFV
jgi:hypothetical protein